MDLAELRKELDAANEQLLDLLTARMDIIDKVAAVKKEQGIARYDPKREEQLVADIRRRAEGKGLNPDFAEDMLKRMIQEAHRIEKEVLGE